MRRRLIAIGVALTACAGPARLDPVDPSGAALAAMLDVRADGCGPRVGYGTATSIDGTLALTAAHVVAGAERVSVVDLDGIEHAARIVWFDPELDLAALRVPTGISTPVALRRDDAGGFDSGVVAVSRGEFDDRVVTAMDVRILRHVDVTTTDIYRNGDVVRPGFEVRGTIEPGDSGTLVVTDAGAEGVIWSRSNTTASRAWAVDVPDDFRSAAFRRSLVHDADPGPCLR